MQETALFLGQGQVYEESSKLLKRLSGVDLSAKQTERLCHHYGEKIENQFAQSQELILEKSHELHYAMIDGSYILSRENGWTETKVGRVFKASDNFSVSPTRNLIKESSYVAHIGTHTDFTEKFSPLLNRLTCLVFIGDGARWMWKWLSDFYPGAVQILDFYHAFEKVGEWAGLVFKERQVVSDWCEQAKQLLLNNELGELLLHIQDMNCQGEGLEKKKALLTYLESNAERMNYKTYLEKGYLIGSGAIESAQRTVVQHRLKKSGQRWTIKGGQEVLNLRTKNLSNQWEEVTNLVRLAA